MTIAENLIVVDLLRRNPHYWPPTISSTYELSLQEHFVWSWQQWSPTITTTLTTQNKKTTRRTTAARISNSPTVLNLRCLHPVARVRSDDVGFYPSTQRRRIKTHIIWSPTVTTCTVSKNLLPLYTS
jgi:hypothetical protein